MKSARSNGIIEFTKMAKCSKCNKRKAKRHCPSLRAELCNLCCGLLRQRELHCPSNCPFLTKHRPYQEKKIIEKRESSGPSDSLKEKDILKDERMGWLALHIEAPLKHYGEKRDSFSDKDAILALEYAKEKLSKARSILIIPGGDTRPKNEVGEAIYKIMEKCRYEKSIILPGESQAYKTDEKIKCLERVIKSAKTWGKDNLEGRSYIGMLITYFDKINELSRQKKIITPG